MLFLCFYSGSRIAMDAAIYFSNVMSTNNYSQKFDVSREYYFKHFVTTAFFKLVALAIFLSDMSTILSKVIGIWTAILPVKRINEMTHKPCQYRQPILQFLISTHSHRFFVAAHISSTHPSRNSCFSDVFVITIDKWIYIPK